MAGENDAINALGDFFDEQPPKSAPPAKPAAPELKLPTAVKPAAPTLQPAKAAAAAPPPPAAPASPATHAEPPPSRAPVVAAAPDADEGEESITLAAPKPKPKRESPPPKEWRCKAGKTIFQEDESSFDIFILEEGKVEIVVAEERVAVVSTPGLVLGEIGALLKRPRSAAVKALTPCTFTVYQDFEALMHHDPGKLLEVARTLATRLADTNDNIEKVFGVLYQAKVKDEVVDNVSLALRGKKPKPNQKQGFFAKLGF